MYVPFFFFFFYSRRCALGSSTMYVPYFTFEAFVEASGSLEELIEVWPAVEHSLERVVVCQLYSRFKKHQ